MRVLVAGASGFVGAALISRLVDFESYEIMALSRTGVVHDGLRSIKCDWKDAYCNKQVLAYSPHILINLVGSSHPRSSIGKEIDEIENALLPFMKLIKALESAELKMVVFASSAGAIYESGVSRVVRFPVDSAYGATKTSVEVYMQALSQSLHCSFVSLRISNPVGFHNKEGFGVVNSFSELVLHNLSPVFIGDFEVRKDYIDVSDVADAVVSVLSFADSFSGYSCYDVGSGRALNAVEIYELISLFSECRDFSDFPFTSSALDIDKLYRVTKWRSKIDVVSSMCKIFEVKKNFLGEFL
ncbi:NAD-dependent epimerase/dehydratase family protein [Zhongshania arctica]|uniref:NAD-dependent epimerase/dehydratase family protein n=1 Tax=Zhongshania arctica TaxID=3238302 RepID=A0ABV3TSZ4_9GAMM